MRKPFTDLFEPEQERYFAKEIRRTANRNEVRHLTGYRAGHIGKHAGLKL